MTDSAGQQFAEVRTFSGERLRFTFIPAKRAGYRADSVRIQIRPRNGRLRQGPEIPVKRLGDAVRAMLNLALRS